VLNVEPIGLASTGQQPYWTTVTGFLIKQCRNQNFETRIVKIVSAGYTTDPFTGPVNGVTISSASPYYMSNSQLSTSIEGRTASGGNPFVDLALSCF